MLVISLIPCASEIYKVRFVGFCCVAFLRLSGFGNVCPEQGRKREEAGSKSRAARSAFTDCLFPNYIYTKNSTGVYSCTFFTDEEL